MSVWKRVRQYANDSVTSIIHGKAWHEETKTTARAPPAKGEGNISSFSPWLETDYVCDYILNGGCKQNSWRSSRRLFQRF